MDKTDFLQLREIVICILDSYAQHPFIPNWLYQLWHPRIKQVNEIKQELLSVQDEKQLFHILEGKRYFMAVHTHSRRLRSKVQDALLETLLFKPEHGKLYQELVIRKNQPAEFLHAISQEEAILRYRAHYKLEHSLFGRFIERLSEEEMTLAAKGGMINGLLTERLGIKETIAHGFHFICQELIRLQKNAVGVGFLKDKVIEGYLEKIDFLQHPANEIYHDNQALVQNARYLLDNLVNSAGVKEDGKARYHEHQSLVNACYWVDALFLVVKSRVALF